VGLVAGLFHQAKQEKEEDLGGRCVGGEKGVHGAAGAIFLLTRAPSTNMNAPGKCLLSCWGGKLRVLRKVLSILCE